MWEDKGVGPRVKRLSSGFWNAHGKVYTEIVPNAAKNRYRPQSGPGRIIRSDGGRGCDGLVDRGYKKHFHVNHGQHEFTRGNCPINGIESFCQTKACKI